MQNVNNFFPVLLEGNLDAISAEVGALEILK